MCFFKDTFGPFGVHKQVEWAHFEPVMANFGPSQGQKGLENGPIWNHRWLKNGSKPWFSKNDTSPVVVPKRTNTAHFEPLLSLARHFPMQTSFVVKSCRQCSFPHQLGPNIQSWLGPKRCMLLHRVYFSFTQTITKQCLALAPGKITTIPRRGIFNQIWNTKLPHRTLCGKYLLLQDDQPAGLFC